MKIKYTVLILLTILFVSCSSSKKREENQNLLVQKSNDRISSVYDPWGPFNRRMYYFNSKLDSYFLLPVTNGYRYVTPDFAEKGVHNFFENLRDVKNFSNSVLQGNMNKSLVSFDRFVINSTFGILGLFDVATKLGLERQNEDFGLTLAHYGVKPGPYLVLPVFGPSSLRDTTGLGVDTVFKSYTDPLKVADTSQSDPLVIGLNSMDTRSNIKFSYHETGSPFEYEYVRYLYLKEREYNTD